MTTPAALLLSLLACPLPGPGSGAAARELAREGTLDLDAPLSTWLGDEAWYARLPNAGDLTLRVLLRHRGELPDHMREEAFLLARLEADLRRYVPTGSTGVIALRARLIAAWGDLPFTMHTPIGGIDGGLRGIYETRYADHAAALAVTEYRRHLFWRVGAVAFVGSGRVASELRNLAPGGLHPAGGVGVRFTLLRESGLNVGLDVASAGEALRTYVTLGEAF